MNEVTIIGLDLAKNVFQLHGAAADGAVVFRKRLSRPQFHRFMSEHPRCVVAMEACGGAHHWAHEMDRLGHAVKLVARRLLAQAVEAEAEPFLAAMKDEQLADGRTRVVRHGHGPERMIQTGIRPVPVNRAKLRDRGEVDGRRIDAVRSCLDSAPPLVNG